MSRPSTAVFALFALVSLAGFVTGWMFRDGASTRAFIALILTCAVSVVAGALATARREP